ncbi:MAG: hydroxymethylbilane synthase [bacterium]|nr:hydroxymethylbilane synthase [bacterium]
MKIRIGTRGSELALWQAHYIAGLLGTDKTEIVIIKTKGDKIQNVSFDKIEGKGFFTKEIEQALLSKEVDLAVHSLKDLTTDEVPGLKLAAIPEREDPSDVLLIHKDAFDGSKPIPLKDGSLVGTSSMRRLAQIKKENPSLEVKALRGNINTRLRKLNERQYDAIVLAYAGVKRINLDLTGLDEYILPHDIFIPAPGQGALGLQIREDDQNTLEAIESLNHPETISRVTAERSFLKHFGGGCHTPLGAISVVSGNTISLTGIVASVDGAAFVKETVSGESPEKAGEELARILKERGAEELV